jgi:hypothetical protein
MEMDCMAKNNPQIAIHQPSHYIIAHEPWSLWFQRKKLTKESNLYHLRMGAFIQCQKLLDFQS